MERQIVKRFFQHMAWANNRMLTILENLPDEAVNFSAWNPDWTVGTIAHHIVISEGRLISRITNQPKPMEPEPPHSALEISQLIEISSKLDEKMLTLIDDLDKLPSIIEFGNEVEFHTSTIFAQAVHHAAEHRAQISDILAANDMDLLNLDEIDLWAFEKWEKSR
ncbi:MAG: DinB family protein [Actinomycetota bacterium]|nr:DinB family protein [Actinomycetota bacterium]